MAAVVWLKRDLRLADHAALAAAAGGGLPTVVLYCYEPSMVQATDFSHCHLQFINESLEELSEGLQKLGGSLVVRHGQITEVLAALAAELAPVGGIAQLLSHQETGTPATIARNAAVAQWAQQQGMDWQELPQTGVVRNLASRDGWAKQWTAFMEQPLLPAPTRLKFAGGLDAGQLLSADELGVAGDPKPEAMKGGERRARELLDSFLGGRAAGYSTNMSSPVTAWEGCSRLSPYLAWGCISLREVYQRTKAAADVLRAAKAGSKGSKGSGSRGSKGSGKQQQAKAGGGKRQRRGKRQQSDEEEEEEGEDIDAEQTEEAEADGEEAAAAGAEGQAAASSASGGASTVGLKDLAAFTARLRWRSHFMQKLEDEPGLVAVNMCRAYDGARNEEAPHDTALFEAWCTGRTGYPMVDAVVRCLLQGGWVNFRMRAMIFSFASYNLWLHWRFTADFMAGHFLDYEPGIHYPQAQMQAGTTGINTFRVYSPTKQVQDQDPEGVFIRKYVPELARVPKQHLAEPWKMPLAAQQAAGCIIGRDYPAPVVQPDSGRQNCRQLYAIKASLKAKEQAAKVYSKHGSRKKPNPLGKRKAAAAAAGGAG
ncbi:deoxyribodipyrimidine photo-lyase [Chlorella sorokiniana]|uniref:Deoxyribodipyrimidine photo-lyase n=1 Tax=Chlorella sorokiniana TaxID=3076 RepID=A0A2P6TTU4_CHLSO|nr:deoxyribodipyrimidine photo-lyase [Chlorella sorokiniana]|eukprot:PRW57446.1 deoxyribodipyrimidine photo-lyase [Chlorella sorokiniana]